MIVESLLVLVEFKVLRTLKSIASALMLANCESIKFSNLALPCLDIMLFGINMVEIGAYPTSM